MPTGHIGCPRSAEELQPGKGCGVFQRSRGKGNAALDAAAKPKGVFSFAKENTPFEIPRERLASAVSGMKEFGTCPTRVPAKFCI